MLNFVKVIKSATDNKIDEVLPDTDRIKGFIEFGANKAQLSPENVKMIVEQVSNEIIKVFKNKNKDQISTKEIYDEILKQLDTQCPFVSKALREYIGLHPNLLK